MRRAYDVVIVGAGIQGLALAYELARRGIAGVCVLEASYPGAGASGRNGELIRSAFSSQEWARFFHASLRRWQRLSDELEASLLFTPSGYLVLATSCDELERFRAWAAGHRRLGIVTEMLESQAVRSLVPALAEEACVGGLYQEEGGFARHDAAVWAYARAAARLGVEIHPFTPVVGLEVRGGRIAGVRASRGVVSTRLVVDAAGGEARSVASLAKVTIPTTTYRLEAIVTESLEPFLRPGIAVPSALAYLHQTARGEVVAGSEQARMEPSRSLVCTLRSLRDVAQKLVRLFPRLAGARLLRQWAGTVDATPDLAPLLGPVPEVEGLWLDCGWVYGFMGAPAAGLLLAEAIESGRLPELLQPFSLERLRQGRLIEEASLVVARETP